MAVEETTHTSRQSFDIKDRDMRNRLLSLVLCDMSLPDHFSGKGNNLKGSNGKTLEDLN